MNSVAIHKPTINVADDYRYKRFTSGLLFRDLRFRKDAARLNRSNDRLWPKAALRFTQYRAS